MNKAAAIAEITRIVGLYRSLSSADMAVLNGLPKGKLYELFVLSDLLQDLAARGFSISFIGTTVKFKASPGAANTSDPHFEITAPGSYAVDFRLFVDVEFETLGASQVSVSDYSGKHELDLVVTTAVLGYPSNQEIALAVECKAVANFDKGIVKAVLGVRRELSYLHDDQRSALTAAGGHTHIEVPAEPPSEFWLAYIDPKGDNYRESPSAFGITFRNLVP